MECSEGSFAAMCEGDECGMLTGCGDCVAAEGCGWCEGSCQSDTTECIADDGRVVPYIHQNLCLDTACSMEDSCDACTASTSGCTWCDGRCTYSLECQQEAPASCEVDCSATTCDDCTTTPGCGWGADGCVEAGTEGSSTNYYLCFCDQMPTCADCTNQGCAWDEGTCDREGSEDAVTATLECEPVPEDPCQMAAMDCAACAETPGCGWGITGCITAMPGTPNVITRAAACYDCTGHLDCTSCATDGFCEWCPGSGCHNTYEEACMTPTPVLECS